MMKFLFFAIVIASGFLNAQHQDKVDFIHAEVFIAPSPKEKMIEGTVIYTFEVVQEVDSVFLDAKHMAFSVVKLNGRKSRFTTTDNIISIHKKFKKGKTYQLKLTYTAHPKQTVYFMGWEDPSKASNQIWTQGQGKYTSHWLPSFDAMEEKVEFDVNISFDPGYEVIANGKRQKTVSNHNGGVYTSFDMQKPMSSYLLAFAIGDYVSQDLTSSSGIPIKNYYYPKDSLRAEPTYRYTKQIFDFLENEIGVPYPWQNYKQLPVRDFLYAGMENTTATIFSDGYMIDSTAFIDKNFVNVNAHEMAHQWFGNLVTEKDGNHHWLHEGFATYYAYLAEKDVFGTEHFYWKLYDTAKALDRLSRKGEGEALTNPKASSLTFYEKGAWALHMLKDQIGEAAFKKGIKNYLEKYRFATVTIPNFLHAMEQASGQDLSSFATTWLHATSFPFELAKENLIKNSGTLERFLRMKWELTTSLEDKGVLLQRYWDLTDSDELRNRIISNYPKYHTTDFYKKAFDVNSVTIRRALATTFNKVPLALKQDFETLLGDNSYSTLENALYRLWIAFPQDRSKYLDQTKGIIGLPNKNVRLLWLVLALVTKDYGSEEVREAWQSELFTYTSPNYSMEVRQGAFGLIGEVFTFSDQNLLDLCNAAVHHSWQFKKFARTLLDQLLGDTEQRARILLHSKGLKGEALRYIKSKLQLE